MRDQATPDQQSWYRTQNPLTQYLPQFSDLHAFARNLAFDPLAGIDVRELSLMERDELLVGEKTPLEPTMQIVRTAMTWQGMLHAGLRRRNPILPEQRKDYWATVMHDPNAKTHPFVAPTRGICVHVTKGATGTGKSVTMGRFCSLYPQVIHHGKSEAAGWNATVQLVFLEVAISHDGTRGGFLIGILTQMDAALGTTYATDLPKKYKRIESLAVATICRLIAHYTGIIFLEEAQLRNLVRCGQADLMQTFLLLLMNSGIPIVFIGNEKAFDWISLSQDLSRLYTTPPEHFIPIGATAMDTDSAAIAAKEWTAIARGIMNYYVLPTAVDDREQCQEALQKHSGGIPRLALYLWCLAQRNALYSGMLSIGPRDLLAAYQSTEFNEHRNLADGFSYRKFELLAGFEDVAADYYKAHWRGSPDPKPIRADGTDAKTKQRDERPSDVSAAAQASANEKRKFKSEQTRKRNQEAKRQELKKTLPPDDIRASGLRDLHMGAFQNTLDSSQPEKGQAQ